MPGGLTLLASLSADIPTPPAGKVTIFFDLGTGFPSYKNSAGAVVSLIGPAGGQGPQGVMGDQGDEPDQMLALPGPQGNVGATGATGAAGPLGPTILGEEYVFDEPMPPNYFPRGSAWELVATQALSGAAQYDFNNLSQYTDIRVGFVGATFGSASEPRLRISTDNGATFLSASGDYVSVSGVGAPTNTTEFVFYTGTATAARSGQILIEGINIVNAPKWARATVFSQDNVLQRYAPTNNAVSGVRLFNSAAVNFTGGTAYVYGRR